MSTVSIASPERHLSIPASSFGIVLGMAGLSNCWRFAHPLWGVDAWVGQALSTLNVIVWLALLVGYVMKWELNREEARAEFEHPVQCCFVGLIPVSTMLIGMTVTDWNTAAGASLIVLGVVGHVAFSVFRSGAMLRGGRNQNDTTAVMYLPAVAGNFVSAIALNSIGELDLAKAFFGAGFFSWLALESIIVNRLFTSESLTPVVRPTLGIQIAPPAVASIAYLAISHNSVDTVVLALFGYAMLQLLLMARLSSWFAPTGFSPSYWAFSFGSTALVLASMRIASLHSHPHIDVLALPLFALLNLAILGVVFGTLRLLWLGKLFMK